MAQGQSRDRDSNSNLDAPRGEQSRPGESLPGQLSESLTSVGLIALVLPLFFHLNVPQTAGAGADASTRLFDYVAICGGVVADACGTLLLIRALTGKSGLGSAGATPMRLAVALLISLLGVVHLLRGLGLIKLGLLG